MKARRSSAGDRLAFCDHGTEKRAPIDDLEDPVDAKDEVTARLRCG